MQYHVVILTGSFPEYSIVQISMDSFDHIKCSWRCSVLSAFIFWIVSLCNQVLPISENWCFGNVLTTGFKCNKPHYSYYFASICKQPLKATQDVNKGSEPKEGKRIAGCLMIKVWSVLSETPQLCGVPTCDGKPPESLDIVTSQDICYFSISWLKTQQ